MKRQNIYGTLRLKEAVESSISKTDKGKLTYPANGTLRAFCDDRDRIFVEHPNVRGCFARVYSGNILEAKWEEESDTKGSFGAGINAKKKTICKPKFYQSVLVPVKGNVLEHVYPLITKFQNGKLSMTMTERMGSEEAKCPECGKNVWIILANESSIVREGGKPYIECMECGYGTHL